MCHLDPARDCVVSCLEDVRLSYGDFKRESEIMARAMIASGIMRGDRVGIWSTNNYNWLLVLYATARVGAIMVNINPAYRSHELAYVLNQSGTKLLFTIGANRGVSYIDTLAQITPLAGSKGVGNTVPELEEIVLLPSVAISGKACEERPRGAIIALDKFLTRAEAAAEQDLLDRARGVQFDDAVNIQYTSGTTGFPKGVTLSHHNLLNNGFFAARAMDLQQTCRFCIPMPFYHCGGMVSSALATLSVGGTILIPAPYFEELTVMKAVQGERATHISGVPTMFISQLEHEKFKEHDYSSLKGGFMAGAPCPVQLMRRVASEMHVADVVILYGLTEVSPLMTSTNTQDTLEARATTVGRAIPGVEVKIIDALTGEILPRDTQGEVCCRGHGVMLGYWQNREATSETIDAAGWLHSGDLGVMNVGGYLHITGRKKDMIVAQAQVFGLPDVRLGEEVALWVALKAGASVSAEELVAFLKERIAHFKIPKHVRFVSEFPMTVTGKIQKFAMREAMVKELGLEQADAIETA